MGANGDNTEMENKWYHCRVRAKTSSYLFKINMLFILLLNHCVVHRLLGELQDFHYLKEDLVQSSKNE